MSSNTPTHAHILNQKFNEITVEFMSTLNYIILTENYSNCVWIVLVKIFVPFVMGSASDGQRPQNVCLNWTLVYHWHIYFRNLLRTLTKIERIALMPNGLFTYQWYPRLNGTCCQHVFKINLECSQSHSLSLCACICVRASDIERLTWSMLSIVVALGGKCRV